MSVKLIQVGDFVTREFPIEVAEFNIGRDYTCNLRLDHGRISRNHCRILKRGHRVLVEALYSTAGTAINDQVLDPNAPPVEVYDGDHLWVGPEHFQFVFTMDHGESSAPSPDHAATRDHRPGAAGEPSNPLLKDVPAAQSRVAHKLLEKLNAPPVTEAPPATPAPTPTPEPKGAVDVIQMDGVALVRVLPRAIVAESDIRTITDELDELIASGQSNITLHLGNVERMSSQVIGEVFQFYRRCKAKGGMLKICEVSPQVAGVFAMTNMQRHIEIFPDERMALKSLWPRQEPSPNPSSPADRDRDKARPGVPERKAGPASATAPTGPLKHVRLLVEVGRAKGRAVEVRGPRFVIGRDQQCQLRPNSNGISRLHTAIEQRDGKVFVRDLGSQIGTILNGRVLLDEEAEVSHGDRLQIEVLQFTFAIEDQAEPPTPGPKAEVQAGAPAPIPKDESLSKLFGEPSTDSSADTTIMTLPEFAAAPAPHPSVHHEHHPKRPRPLTWQDVDDVAVVTLHVSDLSEEAVISAVRIELEKVLGQLDQDRIVIRFDHVKALSRGAVVMFLARAQHLLRSQGTMRFCHVAPQVMSFLEKTQLPLLIEIYPTLKDALQTSWEAEQESGAAAQTGST